MLDQTQVNEAYKTGYEHGFLHAIFRFYVYVQCDAYNRRQYMQGFEDGVNNRATRMEKQEVVS